MADNVDKRLKELKELEAKMNSTLNVFKGVTDEAERWYEYQKDVNSGLDGYIDGVKKLSKLKDDLSNIEEQIGKLKQKQVGATAEENDLYEARIVYLKKQYELINEQREALKGAVKEAKTLKMVAGEAGAAMVKGTAKFFGNLPGFFDKFKEFFEMDKAIRTTVTQMGVLGKQGDVVRQNIKAAAVNTQMFGAGIKEIAEIQAQYTEDLGRNVMLSQQSLEAVAQMGKSTGLGLEGATEMAVQFDKMGISAQKTGEFIQQTLDESKSMGINATKVMKNINQNFKMLNKYRFKDGIKGLIKMAETATKLGVDMEFASSMSDKIWNIEGAVEMSAQLQVLGGAWSQLADPFKLMYMARNDMEGLTKSIAEAASESMTFAKDGSIQLNAMEMQRLKLVAEQTGLEYDKLVEAGKTAFKLSKIKMQSGGLTPDMQEFLANTAEFKDGKATVELKAGPKLVQFLTEQDKEEIKKMQAEKKSMEERAYQAQSFDEKITNLINMVKITLLPIIEGITEVLDPIVQKFMSKDSDFKKMFVELGKNLGEFAINVAKGVKWFVETVDKYFGPEGLLGLYLGSVLLEKASWIANGFALAKGFMLGSGGGMFGGKGSIPGMGTTIGANSPVSLGNGTGSAMTTGGKLMGKNVFGGKLAMGTMGSVAAGAGLGVAGVGTDYLRDSIYGEGSKKGRGLGVASAALKGAGMGMMFGPWGAAIGGLLGAGYGIYDEYFKEPTDDNFVSPNKFGQNHKKRAIVENGSITPIHNKDQFFSAKPGGVIDKAMAGTKSGVSNSKIELGELKINGNISLNLPGMEKIAIDLSKNAEFRRNISTIVQNEINKNINGGKINPTGT